MARSIAEIKQQMIDAKNSESALSGLTSTSTTAKWNLYYFIVAAAINLFEQLQDLFKADIEKTVSQAIPNTAAWLQAKAFEFQYNATTPQILGLTDLVPVYEIVNPAYRIITRCSVVTTNNKNVIIKVAKNTPPEALTSDELNAATSYFRLLGNAGVKYTLLSAASDKIEIKAQVYYNGQYNQVIQANVNAAIENYLSNIDFNGYVYVSKIEDAIQSVIGVVDVKLTGIGARVDSGSLNDTVVYDLVNGINARIYQPYAGYIVAETTSGHTLNDTITYTIV